MEENKPERSEGDITPKAQADQTFKPTTPKQPAEPEIAGVEPAEEEAPESEEVKLAPPEQEETKTAEKAEPLPQEKKRPGFWTRAFRWLAGILILFGLGAALIIFAFYLPSRDLVSQQNQELAELSRQHEAELAAAQEEIAGLKQLGMENEELRAENQTLQAAAEQSKVHLTLVQVRIDVISAQIALMKEIPGEARLALSNTAELLEELKQMLPEHVDHIQDMLDRLERIKGEMDEDPDLAILDLDSLLNDLLWLENAVVR